jgi:hypothetical protein
LGIGLTSQSRKNKFVEKTTQLKFQPDGCLGDRQEWRKIVLEAKAHNGLVLEKEEEEEGGGNGM